jgi:molybdopterin converting factor subunit 1
MITVDVKLFAIVRDIVGKDELSISLEEESRAISVLDKLGQEFPRLAEWKSHLRLAVNSEYVTREQVLKHRDEVAIIPPVSGG